MPPYFKTTRTVSLVVCILISAYFLVSGTFPNLIFLLYLLSCLLFFSSYIPWKAVGKIITSYWIDFALAGLFVTISLGLYLFRLTEITPGAWGDEIVLGYMVENLTKLKSFTPYVMVNYGHPTLLVYLSSLFISFMGRSLVSLRIVSVAFGALNVGIFYLLLRIFFKKFESTLGAVLLATSYIHIIVARFAYEMSAAIFFLIMSFLMLSFFYKKKGVVYVVLLGATLALGIYTYLAFRLVAVVLFLFALIAIVKEKQNKLKNTVLLFISSFVILTPLAAYSIHHPGELNARMKSLSVFSQKLPTVEVVKELRGATYRTLTMFFVTGDPNPRQNPANTPPFDIVTSFLFFLGLVYLFLKKRSVFFVVFILTAGVIAAEIVTLERIPEFHYYGLGHPNTLRISLLAPIIAFVVLWGLQFISKKLSDNSVKRGAMVITVIIISVVNLNRYYSQKMSQWIYTTNSVVPLKVVDFLNKNKPGFVYLSPAFYDSEHINYLLNTSVKMIQIPEPIDCTFDNIQSGLSFIAAADLSNCTKEKLAPFMQKPPSNVSFMISPWNTIDAIVFIK